MTAAPFGLVRRKFPSVAAAGLALCMVACGETGSTAPAVEGSAPDRDVYLHVEHMIGLVYRSRGGHVTSPDTDAPKRLPELFTLDGKAYAPTTPETLEPRFTAWKFGAKDGHNVQSGPVWIDHGHKTLPRLLVSPGATPEEIKLRTPARNEGAGALPDALREQAIDDTCKRGGTAEAVQHVGEYYVVRTTCNVRDEPKVPKGMVFVGNLNAAIYRASGGKPIHVRFGSDWRIRITHLLDLDGDGVDEALAVIKPGTLDWDNPRDLVLFEGDQRVAAGMIGHPMETWGLETAPLIEPPDAPVRLAPPFERNLAIHGCRVIDKGMVARELGVDEQAIEVQDERSRCRFKWPTGTAELNVLQVYPNATQGEKLFTSAFTLVIKPYKRKGFERALTSTGFVYDDLPAVGDQARRGGEVVWGKHKRSYAVRVANMSFALDVAQDGNPDGYEERDVALLRAVVARSKTDQ